MFRNKPHKFCSVDTARCCQGTFLTSCHLRWGSWSGLKWFAFLKQNNVTDDCNNSIFSLVVVRQKWKNSVQDTFKFFPANLSKLSTLQKSSKLINFLFNLTILKKLLSKLHQHKLIKINKFIWKLYNSLYENTIQKSTSMFYHKIYLKKEENTT